MPKLYIIPIAYDEEAILKTLFQSHCQKVCLLSAERKPDAYRVAADLRTQEVEQSICDRLEGLVEVEVLRFSWKDHEDMIESLTAYLKRHEDWDMVINYSFGSTRLTPVLLMLASLYNITLEYTFCNEFRPELLKGDWHTGFHSVDTTPTPPLAVDVSDKELQFLRVCAENPDLHAQAYIQALGGDENKLRAEFNYYLDKLAARGFVHAERAGNRQIATLTSTGSLIVKLKQ